VGDYNGDGLEDLYVCQPAGLPNRLLRNNGNSTFDDVSAAAGVNVLDATSMALFADFDNDRDQDLLLVMGTQLVLRVNGGAGRFVRKANPGFGPATAALTSAAVADFDRDGWLDIYVCAYDFWTAGAVYDAPTPYYDATNGPPNQLYRNRGNGTFKDVIARSGMNANNNRFSFAASWADYDQDGWPDLYVANDFGRNNLYRNRGDGTFEDVAARAGVEDLGAGMSVAWGDYDGDGWLDLYVSNMWSSAGQRLTAHPGFAAGVAADGAMAELTTESGRKLVRIVQAGSGYLTQSSRRLHFALPRGEKANRLRIRWPDGAEQVARSVPERGSYRLTQGAESFESINAQPIVARASAVPEIAASVWLVEPMPAPAMKGVTAGRRTLVNFWASWCPLCREEMKEWSAPESLRRFAAAGVRVVVASVDEDAQQRPVAGAPFTLVRPSPEELAAWSLFHRHLFDRRREIGLPASFLLDERGQVVKVYQGVAASAQIAADALRSPAVRRSLPFAGIWLGERPRRSFTELATALAERGLPTESARYFELAIARGGKTSRETMNNYAGVLLESGERTKTDTMLQPLLTSASPEDDVLAGCAYFVMMEKPR